MLNLTKTTYFLLQSMLFSPFLSYITLGVLNLNPIDFYYRIIFVLYGFIFVITQKNIVIPKFALFALIWVIYHFIWTMINGGDMGMGGFIGAFIKSPHLAIFFILVIIYNTKFSRKFILRTITIFKITVVIAFCVSIIQLFDSSFLNASHLWSWLQDVNIQESSQYVVRRHSIFGYIDLNAVGLSFLPILAILIGVLLYRKIKSQIFYLILGGVVSFLTNTRYIMLGFVITSMEFLMSGKSRIQSSVKFTILVVAMFFLGIQLFELFGYNISEWLDARVFREGSVEQSERYASYLVFLQFFPEYFIFGNGNIMAEEIVRVSTNLGTPFIHVGYLAYLVSYGIVGCFFLFGFWFLLFKKLLKTAKATQYWGSLFAFLTFLMSFATMVEVSIFFYGLIFALVFDKYFSDMKVQT